jgi:hypothetical protein
MLKAAYVPKRLCRDLGSTATAISKGQSKGDSHSIIDEQGHYSMAQSRYLSLIGTPAYC